MRQTTSLWYWYTSRKDDLNAIYLHYGGNHNLFYKLRVTNWMNENLLFFPVIIETRFILEMSSKNVELIGNKLRRPGGRLNAGY